MKNFTIILFLAFIFVFTNSGIAQKSDNKSIIRASTAWWSVQKEQIPIAKALKGVFVKEKLKLSIVLDPQTLLKADEAMQKFEIKWYRYGVRGLYLTNSFVESINIGEEVKKNKKIILESSRGMLQKGWWIVTIVAYHDNGFVTLDGKTQYKIKIL